MKSNMLSKYIAVYIGVAIISFIAVSFVCYKIDYNRVYQSYSDALYSQANDISKRYAKDYFSVEHLSTINAQLETISKLNDTRIMFVDPTGNVMLDTGFKGTPLEDNVLYTIDDFDYSKLNGKHSQFSNFYGVFDENVLSVYSPINKNYILRGYVVINMPASVIEDRVYLTFNTNYLTLAIVCLLSLSFLALYFIYIHIPINELTKATKEYGKGNLSYRINSKHNDEIGKLAISLDYMAAKLNEMDQYQQKFLSNISHDFRSPLTSIKGYLEAIQDETIPAEMINKYINIVLFETDRLTRLTSNILTLNELDPKTVSLELSVFDINSIIKHTIETMEGNCKKKKIKFSLAFAGSIENVKADKGKIQQVIYNLIDNAIKFSHENSIIYITVKEKGDKAQISIKDTGIGIPKDDIDKIWDRFYKSDSSRGKDKKGSGLGLSITKEIIQAHDEHIDVISTTNVGTEFIFTLPLAKDDN